MKKALIVLIILALTAPGCSWFKDSKEKNAEELASDGIRLYEKGDYTQAIDSFVKLKDWYPFSKYAILAELKLADAYFQRKNYEDAIYAYEYFEGLHPRNEAIPYVIFQIGMCYFKQMALPDRDQTATESAVENFMRLAREYPESPEAAMALEHVKICQDTLARHDLFVGAYYFKAKEFHAARVRFADILSTYPDVGVHRRALEYLALCDAFIAKEEAKAMELKAETQEERREEAEKYKKKLDKERAKATKQGIIIPQPEEDTGVEE
ncbi:MAG: outer membrane protein assembly factor BamD [Desulfatibacillum sp.]|nr:outer membrane protein assembly factor BamD [Desulfatibacillum sp.]